jgi:hypothetical protein
VGSPRFSGRFSGMQVLCTHGFRFGVFKGKLNYLFIILTIFLLDSANAERMNHLSGMLAFGAPNS